MPHVGAEALNKILDLIAAKFNSLSTVATTGSYNDLSDKPTIPSVGNGRITVKQGGTTKGTFTVNQTGATTIELTDNDTHYASGTVVTNDATKTGNYASALSNGNVYLNHVENGAVKNSHKITGAGATTVESDASGNIIITSADNAATATKLKNARTIALSGGATGTATSFDGSTNITIPVTNISPDYIGNGYLNTHPENDLVIIPFINNDIAYLTKRGGSVVVKYDDVVQNVDISAVFDGSASYWGNSTIGTKVETVTIELTLHKTFAWSNTIYIDSGSKTWRAKDIKIEVMNTNYADDVWTTKRSLSNYSRSQCYVRFSHKPVGASNFGGGFNKVRLTFSNFNNPTFRIAAIGVIGCTSSGLRETFLPKDGGSVYGNILPYADNSYNLGSSSNNWANIYATKFTGALTGNADTASKWATARNINGMLVQGDANRVNYGTCSTAAATAAKVVDCTGFELVTGAEITVKFTVTNEATQPTLNVNGTGAQTIYYRGNYISPSYLAANRTYTFRYSGTGYDLVGDLDTDINSDTKVSQTLVSDNASYPLLLAPSGQTATKTTTARFDSGVTLNPSTNTIAANISGSAAKVTNALTVKANGTSVYTYDGSAAKTINIKAGSNVTITSDNSGNIIINSRGDSSGDAGVIVYEAESGGLYCNGKTTKELNVNACEIQDLNPNGYYKRFRFYCQGYYGLVCVDMPLDRQHSAYGATDGTRYGGAIFPTAENGNINSTGIGPSNHMYYELKWKVTKGSGYWTVQVIDSGWLGLNAGKTSDANYKENASTADAGTGYVSWNQRHNNQYCIYKIVAYTN